MRTNRIALPVFSALLMTAACGPESNAPELAATHQQIEDSNALNLNDLNLNALNLNALNLNALNLNALNLNALNLNALNLNALDTLTEDSAKGQISRDVLRYMVGCAFDSNQTFSFSWTDDGGADHVESFPGVIGLAPRWQSRALTAAEEEWISACVASRTNYYGVPVSISSRGGHPTLLDKQNTTESEKETYTLLEGAFWGSLFGENPFLRSCHFAQNVWYSRDRNRACAAGHENPDGSLASCGPIERLGSCRSLKDDEAGGSSTACTAFGAGQFYTACVRPDGTRTNRVITTWLK